MAKRGGLSGKEKATGIGCFIVIVVVLFFFIGIGNILNFEVAATHGFGQYFRNIVHLHKDTNCKTKLSVNIYDTVVPIKEVKQKKAEEILKQGGKFKLKGYKALEHITWIAVKFYKGTKAVNGYFIVPKKVDISTFSSALHKIISSFGKKIDNAYFAELSPSDEEILRKSLYEKFKKSAFNKVKIKMAQGEMEIQKIEESDNYKVISYLKSAPGRVYYSKGNDIKTIKSLYDKYLGNNFETHYLQIKNNYNPETEGVYKKKMLLQIIDSIYFKILFIIFLFLFFKFLSRSKPS
jgi:hypothetical protein